MVGAGFAGLQAAIALQERRHEVVLLERRGILGGRATSFRDALSGEDVDNGTHLMVGAYRATWELLQHAGAMDLVLAQDNLRLDYVDDKGPTALVCPPFVAPLHLLAGLLSLRLPWRARWDALRLGLAVRFGRSPQGTLAEAFARSRQSPAARRLLWDPLTTAILNETPERAAAALFWNVYREAFLSDHRASRLVFLRAGWARLHERLAAYFERRGGTLRRRALAQTLEVEQGRLRAIRFAQGAGERAAIQQGQGAAEIRLEADAVVLAVPWSAVRGLLPPAWREEAPFQGLSRIEASPIVSVEMWLDQVVVEPAMVGLRDSELEWVFDKGRLFGRNGGPQHLAFIVSAARRSLSQPNAELVAAAETALRRYFPAMKQARVTRSHVLREPAATFACTPEAERLRPGVVTPIAGLYLAGDWTDTGLPATIEGAVRSGLAAARALDQRAR